MKAFIKSCIFIMVSFSLFCCKETFDPNELADDYKECCGVYQREWVWTYDDDTAYIYLPNAFTPNGDGINDLFYPITNKNVNYIESFKIQTNDDNKTILFFEENIYPDFSNKAWDGKDLDGKLFKGSFLYVLRLNILDDQTKLFVNVGCCIICETGSKALKNNIGCLYPIQIDSSGKLINPWPYTIDPCFN